MARGHTGGLIPQRFPRIKCKHRHEPTTLVLHNDDFDSLGYSDTGDDRILDERTTYERCTRYEAISDDDHGDDDIGSRTTASDDGSGDSSISGGVSTGNRVISREKDPILEYHARQVWFRGIVFPLDERTDLRVQTK
uniref:Uncharacterized protein n=1 Tax=Vespula pensylvanica TaxID=30213 RepID=A0A834P2D5_VESPE|nr:hypothetical protein H0235_007993 [Vespula pensylvanica]